MGAIVPAAQGVGTSEPVPHELPAGQSKQLVPLKYWPTSQLVVDGETAPSSQTCRSGHLCESA